MIKVICDCCKKECDDKDFFCDLKVQEKMASLTGKDMSVREKVIETNYQICKGCFSTHISKLFK